MRPLDETDGAEDSTLPVDGFEVEEVSDESTIRQFVADWRRRVSRSTRCRCCRIIRAINARLRLY